MKMRLGSGFSGRIFLLSSIGGSVFPGAVESGGADRLAAIREAEFYQCLWRAIGTDSVQAFRSQTSNGRETRHALLVGRADRLAALRLQHARTLRRAGGLGKRPFGSEQAG